MFAKACILAVCFAVINANIIDSSVEEMRSLCANDDTIACINYKFMSFLNTVFKKNSFKLSDNVEVVRNEYRANEVNDARSEPSFEDSIKEYIQCHDVTFKLPLVDTSVTVGARNLDNDELNLKLKFADNTGAQEARGKLKKIMVPIMAFIFFKAFTLIPLALGVFGIGTMHALQFSLFNFILAIVMTVFQFSKKITADNAHLHGPWEAYKQRSFDNVVQPQVTDDAQNLAYKAHY